MNNFIDQIFAQLDKKNPLYIRVKVIPQSPLTEIADQMEDGTYKIKVAGKPIRGEANHVLCRFLKKQLHLKQALVVSGAQDKIKLLRLDR